MDILTPTDIIVLKAGILGALAYGAKSIAGTYLQTTIIRPDLPLLTAATKSKASSLQPTRSILKQLDQNNRSCMVFYGSQTGTAEIYAHTFAREGLARYNLGCVIGDLNDYDFGDISKLSEKHLIVFMLATYGEGEPTDNAIAFQNFIDCGTSAATLDNLHYSAFGLGSSSYTYYNAMVARVDQALSGRKANRIGNVGMGDDGTGTLDEDFALWLGTTLPLIAAHYNLPEIPYIYKPAFQVVELLPDHLDSRHIFLGEPNKAHLYNRVQGPFTAQNPFPAKVTRAQELFSGTTRSCLQVDFDVSGTSISYDTGDHLAVWPVNSDSQVDLFLRMFGLFSKKNHEICITPTDPNNRRPVPEKTTYEAVARHYLDVCTVVTRQTLRKLSNYSTSDTLRSNILELVSEKAVFATNVTNKKLTIAEVLFRLNTNNTSPAIDAPFSLILEIIPKLRPRHYSISSSSLKCRKSISITAVIDSRIDPQNQISFKGVSTSYLAAIKATQDRPNSSTPTHTLQTPRQSNCQPSPLIHVRRSKFRPPFNPSIPIVMIGPGTGVAPFRAFIEERALQHSQGRKIGRTLLFYGCRNESEDFLYKEDWEELQTQKRLGDGIFDMYTAFSRQPDQPRRYVQDLIMEEDKAEQIRELILRQDGRIYVCGNASRMAKDVARTLGKVLAEADISGDGGADIIARLKKEKRYCEDVW